MSYWNEPGIDRETHWEQFKPSIKPELNSGNLKDWLREELGEVKEAVAKLRDRFTAKRG